jgi:hypothetical protein
MNLLGVRLTMLIGPSVPIPAPIMLSEALHSVEVTHNDSGTSGFQISFRVGRTGPTDLLDFALAGNPLLRPFNRVVLIATFNAVPKVLMDGMITQQQLSPSNEPGQATLSLTGEDLSVMLDMQERSVEHPAQDETVIANKILLSYAQYGLIPMVLPPPTLDVPLPVERTPVQQGTDLAYLREMAARYGYVFYITPGPAPMTNTAYWGPPIRAGIPQRALSVNMGPETNVEQINFRHNGLAPALSEGQIQDRVSNRTLPVMTPLSTRPPLASQPAWLANQPNVRRAQFRDSGLSAAQAFARAQGETDASMDDVLVASGELDALKYGDLLQPRALVGLRGVGFRHDGLYYVKSVTHRIQPGDYRQDFTLTREGQGSTLPVLPT